jgi:hypothetical protein
VFPGVFNPVGGGESPRRRHLPKRHAADLHISRRLRRDKLISSCKRIAAILAGEQVVTCRDNRSPSRGSYLLLILLSLTNIYRDLNTQIPSSDLSAPWNCRYDALVGTFAVTGESTDVAFATLSPHHSAPSILQLLLPDPQSPNRLRIAWALRSSP